MNLLIMIRNTIKQAGYARKEWKHIEKEAVALATELDHLRQENEMMKKHMKNCEHKCDEYD